MPLERLHKDAEYAWGLWHVEEEQSFFENELPGEAVPDVVTNPIKKLEYLASRLLVKHMVHSFAELYHGLSKDEYGKPFLNGSSVHVSLSHSYPYVAAIIDRNRNVGIDIEQIKPKLLKVAPRFLSEQEVHDAASNLEKLCVYWCAKEALIKIYGKNDLFLRENLRIEPFSMGKRGEITGRIIANNSETTIPLQYFIYNQVAVVLNR